MSGYACRLTVREVEARGLDSGPALERLRLHRNDLEDSTLEVPAERVLAALRVLRRLTRDPDLGLAAGRQARISDFPAANLLLRGSQDLRAARSAFDRYADAWGPRHVSVEQTDQALTVRLLDAFPTRLVADCHLVAVVTLFDAVAGAGGPSRMRVRHTRPHRMAGYRRAFADVPEFDAPECSVTFRCTPAHVLPHADQVVVQSIEPMVRTQAGLTARRPRDLNARVRAAIITGLDAGPVTLAGIAIQVSETERSLRRKLHHEGLTFAGLLDETRRELALHLVTDAGPSVREMASRLGYADPATFTRAFRRWTGNTVTAWRVAMREQQ